MEQIYTQQEVATRFNLHQFIHFIGEPTVPSKSDTPRGITPEELLDVFSITHRNEINPQIARMFLLTGGFVAYQEVQIKLYLKINVSNFAKLSLTEQTKVIKWVDGPLSITLRKMMLGYTKIPKSDSNLKLETPLTIFIRRFLNYYCMDDRTRYGSLLSTETRASTKQLYSYYITVCASLNYSNPLGLKKFIEFLRNLGYSVQKGYVRGVSGINFVNHIHIPQLQEDLRDSVNYGMCIITINGERFTSELKYKFYTDVALEELNKSRLRRMLDVDESSATPTTEETAESGEDMEPISYRQEDGGSEEIGRGIEEKDDTVQIEISETTEIDIPDDGGICAESEVIQDNDSKVELPRTRDEGIRDEVADARDTIPEVRPINREPVILTAKPSNSTYKRRGPIQIARKPISSSNTAAERTVDDVDPMAGKAELLLHGTPEAIVDIDAIVEALKIPLLTLYGNDPNRMSKEDINNYLTLMHLATVGDDICEQIIQRLK